MNQKKSHRFSEVGKHKQFALKVACMVFLIQRMPFIITAIFAPNSYKAKEEDFKNQTHTVFNDSKIEFTVLK